MIPMASVMRTLLSFSLLVGMPAAANSQTPAAAPGNSLTLPVDTMILAKLATNLELWKCKPGDAIEAQTTEDIRQGKDVLVKKGSRLIGHVSLVEPSTHAQPETVVGIVFDGVKAKNGSAQSIRLLIRAMAPEPEGPTNSTISEGRGMPGATTAAATLSHEANAGSPGGSRLSPSSVGVSGFPGVRLENRKETNGQVLTIVAFAKPDVKFKKGTQLVMKVVGQ